MVVVFCEWLFFRHILDINWSWAIFWTVCISTFLLCDLWGWLTIWILHFSFVILEHTPFENGLHKSTYGQFCSLRIWRGSPEIRAIDDAQSVSGQVELFIIIDFKLGNFPSTNSSMHKHIIWSLHNFDKWTKHSTKSWNFLSRKVSRVCNLTYEGKSTEQFRMNPTEKGLKTSNKWRCTACDDV